MKSTMATRTSRLFALLTYRARHQALTCEQCQQQEQLKSFYQRRADKAAGRSLPLPIVRVA